MAKSQKKRPKKGYIVLPAPTQETYSASEYTRLGDQLRGYEKTCEIPETQLEMLQSLRTGYKTTLAKTFRILQHCVRKVDPKGIVTYRVKRIDSIISKLQRMHKTRLPQMEDIAGCRCILSSNEKVYELKELLEQELDIRSDRNDYIKDPKEDGYRSLHLIAKTKDEDSKVIEVQLRCENDHNWATLVEITDQIYNTKIKEGGDEPSLKKMLFLLSKGINRLDENELSEFFKIVKNKSFVDKVNDVFVKNSLEVRKQWSSIEKKFNYSFYLISVDQENKSTIESYRTFIDAEEKYFEKFKEHPDNNIVLTHISDAKFEQISKAYSNYTLTRHSFIGELMSKLKEISQRSFQESKYFYFVRHFSFYTHVYFSHTLLHLLEMVTANTSDSKGVKKKEWEKSVKNRLDKIVNDKQMFFSEIVRKEKKTFLQHIMLYKMKKIWKESAKEVQQLIDELRTPRS